MPAVHSDDSESAPAASATARHTEDRQPDAYQQAHHTTDSGGLVHELRHAGRAAQVHSPPHYGAAANRHAVVHLPDIQATVLTSRNPCLVDRVLPCPLLANESAPVNSFGAGSNVTNRYHNHQAQQQSKTH